MSRTNLSLSAALLLLVLFLGGAYASGGEWRGPFFAVLLGFLWWALRRRSWPGLGPLGFGLCLGLAAYGVWLDLSILILLPGVIFGLSAWDLTQFNQTMRNQVQNEMTARLERHHLRRLLIVDAVALVFSTIPLMLHIRLNLVLVILFGLLLVWSLSRATGLSKKAAESN